MQTSAEKKPETNFHDRPSTTHADILALFDRAIAARKADLAKVEA